MDWAQLKKKGLSPARIAIPVTKHKPKAKQGGSVKSRMSPSLSQDKRRPAAVERVKSLHVPEAAGDRSEEASGNVSHGAMNTEAASIIMTIMYAARMARFDLLRAINWPPGQATYEVEYVGRREVAAYRGVRT